MHVDPHHRFVCLLVNFCWRRDHLEYVSLVLLGGFHGLVTSPCLAMAACLAISPRYTFSFCTASFDEDLL